MRTDHHVFTSKDDPETEQDGIEESLSDVRVESHEWHVKH